MKQLGGLYKINLKNIKIKNEIRENYMFTSTLELKEILKELIK